MRDIRRQLRAKAAQRGGHIYPDSTPNRRRGRVLRAARIGTGERRMANGACAAAAHGDGSSARGDGRAPRDAAAGPPGGVRIEVLDTGPGIAPEHQQAIFEKFKQIDQSVTREHARTGLGLAIARELTLLLGGTIGVESEVGRGSTFWIELPAEAPESGARPLPALT